MQGAAHETAEVVDLFKLDHAALLILILRRSVSYLSPPVEHFVTFRFNSACVFSSSGARENGRRLQGPGKCERHRPRRRLPQYDCLQKGEFDTLGFLCEGKTRRATTRERGSDSPLVRVNVRSSRERLETSSSVSHCFLQHSATNCNRPGFAS